MSRKPYEKPSLEKRTMLPMVVAGGTLPPPPGP
jgi:hypothetical protein